MVSSRTELVELTNMCMIYDGDKVLVQNRIKSWKGIAFPGGHVENHESIVDSVVREIKEETGLTISHVELCGIKQWFKDGIRNVCFLFKTSCFEGDLIFTDEGKNMWVKLSDLHTMNLAANFEIMLKVFLGNYCEHYHERMYDDGIDILK